MTASTPVMLFDAAGPDAQALESRLAARGFAAQRRPIRPPAGDLSSPPTECPAQLAVVALPPDASPNQTEQVIELVQWLGSRRVATLVWGGKAPVPAPGAGLVDWLNHDASPDEVLGRLTAIARFRPMVQRLERELDHMQRLGEQLNRYFGEIDQEMRLAGRLQRDFLPRRLPELGSYRFGALYRPATWVSGDLYDVFRVDEDHLGVFIADAMGHGVAAGLLTMFLRQALVAKQVDGQSYRILSPAETLANLHAALVSQRLPSCQFVTAVYGVLNIRSGRLRIARAGHPYPIHIAANGSLAEIRVTGGLLGLPDVTLEFEEADLVLAPGEKIVLYTDGIEDQLLEARSDSSTTARFRPALQGWTRLSVDEFVGAVDEHMNCQEGSLHPPDDITVLVLESLRPAG